MSETNERLLTLPQVYKLYKDGENSGVLNDNTKQFIETLYKSRPDMFTTAGAGKDGTYEYLIDEIDNIKDYSATIAAEKRSSCCK